MCCRRKLFIVSLHEPGRVIELSKQSALKSFVQFLRIFWRHDVKRMEAAAGSNGFIPSVRSCGIMPSLLSLPSTALLPLRQKF